MEQQIRRQFLIPCPLQEIKLRQHVFVKERDNKGNYGPHKCAVSPIPHPDLRQEVGIVVVSPKPATDALGASRSKLLFTIP